MNLRSHRFTGILVATVAAFLLCAAVTGAAPVSTAFTYQGQLKKAAVPYTGTGDFVFRLFDDPAAGNQVGADVTVSGLTVDQGLFSTELDFGDVFSAGALWLEIQVQTPGDGGFTTLTPRQALTASPFAIYALSAPGGGGTSQWISDAYGITHPGNVGIGSPSRLDRRLMIDGGTTANPLWLRSNSANYAALAVENDAAGGYGLYDQWSARTFLAGSLGVGTSAPSAKIEVLANSGLGIKTVSSGSLFAPINAAIRVHGATGTGFSGTSCVGVWSSSTDDRAVAGFSTNYWGVSGDCTSAGTYGILGTPNEGIYGSSPNVAKPAGHFVCPAGGVAIQADGIVKVKTLQILGGADLAERFNAPAGAEPGTVMAIDEASPGQLRVAAGAYSRTVAGVVSGANALDAGVVMSRDGHDEGTVALALTGRVWVKCDATHASIHAGDLLTTADRAGHAMRADDRDRAQGAILGKAMSSLESGTGLVLVLVSLQ